MTDWDAMRLEAILKETLRVENREGEQETGKVAGKVRGMKVDRWKESNALRGQ